MHTSVDGLAAKHYLEHHVSRQTPLDEDDEALAHAVMEADSAPLTRATLQLLTRRFSTDLATLYFVDHLYRDPNNRRLQDAFHEKLAQLESQRPDPDAQRAVVLVFVPGYAYQLDTTTGASFSAQRRLLEAAGFETLLIQTDELGLVEHNANLIAREIVRLSTRRKHVILVSASKAGPEVALALGEILRPEESHHVKAWISIGGLLQGSPYADLAMKWPLSWVARVVSIAKGLRPDVIPNLATAHRRAVFARLSFPSHVLTVQYIGAPLSGDVSPDVRGRYNAIKALGPNDGLTLLVDELVPGGVAITDLGLDHYYRDVAIDRKTLALAYVVLEELQQRRPETG